VGKLRKISEDSGDTVCDFRRAVTQPRWLKLVGAFTPRGGIWTNVIVEYHTPGR